VSNFATAPEGPSGLALTGFGAARTMAWVQPREYYLNQAVKGIDLQYASG
jgi:hypothetical protein